MTNQNQEELFTGLSDFSDLDVQKIPGMDERRDKLQSKYHRVKNNFLSKM